MDEAVDLSRFEEKIKNHILEDNFSKKQIFINICQKIKPWVLRKTCQSQYYKLSTQDSDKKPLNKNLIKKSLDKKKFITRKPNKKKTIAKKSTNKQDDVYKKLFDLINKIYEDNFFDNVQWRLGNFYSLKSIFNHFCALNGYQQVKESHKIHEWFHLYSTNQPISNIDEKYYDLVKQMEKCRRVCDDGIYIEKGEALHCMPSNLRFVFGLAVEKGKKYEKDDELKGFYWCDSEKVIILEVTDLYFEEKRTMKFKHSILSQFIDEDDEIKFVEIIGNQILLMVGCYGTYVTHLVLLEFDFKTNKCEVINSYNTEHQCFNIFVDQKNPQRFLVVAEEDDLFRVIVKNNRIYFSKYRIEKFLSGYGDDFKCQKLAGDKFYILKTKFDGEDQLKKATFWNCDLKSRKVTATFDCKIDENVKIGEKFFDDYKYTWCGEICYTMATGENLVIFDANTQKCSSLNLEFMGPIDSMQSSNENDGILLLKTHGHTFYKLSLRKPDTLFNLVWIRTQAWSKFYDNSYEHMKSLFSSSNTEFCPFT